MASPLVKLVNVDVAVGGTIVLRNLRWRLMPREHWAILGRNGSGKTTFLKLIRGELWPAPGRCGRRVYALDGETHTSAVGIKQQFALVSPELQQRYLQQEWNLTAREVIRSGFGGGDYVYEKLNPTQERRAGTLAQELELEPLLGRNVQQLSTGELRRVLIARALVGSPRVLVCDEICDGLDATARAHLQQTLDRVAERGTQLLYTTHRNEELVRSMTHWLVLERGRITEQGKNIQRDGLRTLSMGNGRPMDRPLTGASISHLREQRPIPLAPSQTLISIKSVNVFQGLKQVLFDIAWELHAGENWAILGPNGAGKSTLLKLICGDIHPARGGRVRRFEFTPRHTLWDLRRRIGFVSPELQANYREAISGADVIASGFFASVGLRQAVTRRQQDMVAAVAERLGIRSILRKPALAASYGEFRKLLLARSLVHDPSLLVLDEPFDGLDATSKLGMGRALEAVARHGTSLVVVTHHPADLPGCMTHFARLEGGRIVERGQASEILHSTTPT